jgi:hypothetical protein
MHIVIMLTLVVGTALVLTTLGGEGHSPTPADVMKVKERHETSLMSIPGVVAVGIGEREGEPTIKVFVEEATPGLEGRIPEWLEGIKVDVEPTDPITIFEENI